MDRQEAVDRAREIGGWMKPEELGWLYDQAKRCRGTWVEIGSWKGRSTLATAMGLAPGAELVCVDTFRGMKSSVKTKEAWDSSHVHSYFLMVAEEIVSLRPDIHLTIVHRTSARASTMFATGSVDAVFIDGDHAYEAISRDIALWYPKTTSQGLFSGHDRTIKGVARALAEWKVPTERACRSIWKVRR